jgi:hypothetical protein
MYSSNGITWTPTLGFNAYGNAIAYANGRWFVYSSGDALLYYSDDNTQTWTSVSSVPDFSDLTAGDTLIGVTGDGLYYSYDNGISWTQVSGSPIQGNAIAYANGTYVAVGNYICSATDTNILSFTLQPAAIQPSLAPV